MHLRMIYHNRVKAADEHTGALLDIMSIPAESADVWGIVRDDRPAVLGSSSEPAPFLQAPLPGMAFPDAFLRTAPPLCRL